MEHANAITEMEKRTTEKTDKLSEVMLQMAKEKEERRGRHRQQYDSDGSSSEEKEERARAPQKT